MKDFIKKIIEQKEKRATELRDSIQNATTADEVRSFGTELDAVNAELNYAKQQLLNIDNEGRSITGKNFNPMATFSQNNNEERKDQNNDPYSTLEYRKAFKEYVQKGTAIPNEYRAGGDTGTTSTAELGAIIPTTVMNEVIREVIKVRGQIFSKVRKLNVPGGIEFPISKMRANFKWVTETTVSEKQKAGDADDKVTFKYNIGEIRVAETLLASIVALPVFEQEIQRIIVEAFLEAMDDGIISGTGSGQLLGITKDPRVTNVIEMTANDFGNWTAWRKKLFAVILLSKRGGGEFLFPASTIESNLLTMKDANDRPLFKEATDLTSGNLAGSFFGRTVTYVEPDVIKDFDTANAGDVVGIFWNPLDYAVNTNMQFGVKRYFDENTNEWINKALVIIDGKILDSSGCYIIKKK